MPRTPLLSQIRRLAAEHRLALHRRVPVDVVRHERAEAAVKRGTTRRDLLLGSAAVATLAACKKDETTPAPTPGAPRIAIVGAGIAGLSAALTLRDKGVAATVYDMFTHRVGGRMVTERGSEPTGCNSCHVAPGTAPSMSWSDGQVTDIYGELIDSGHTTIHALAQRFGLALTDALAAQPVGSTETWYFNGGYYTQADADTDFAAIYDALMADADAAGWPVTFDTVTPAGRVLDDLSIYDWIESRVPGGHTSRLGRLLDAAYCMEYGAETTDQSSLNLISMLSGSSATLSVLGESDEQYRLAGGIDQLPRAIGDHLGIGDVVKLGFEFQALRMEADGSYTLSFDTDGGTEEVRADYVVLAIPFGALRTRDFSAAGFDALKEQAIMEQGQGRNCKLQLQFTARLWNQAGAWGIGNGSSYSDTGYQLSWDPTRGQAGTSGILVGYNGGDAAGATALAHPYGNSGDPDVVADAQAFLAQIEPVFPGLTALWNGKCAETKAHIDRRFNCSYSYYRVGQTQDICGYEREPQGNVFFCGEHTSIENLGFMEGAASEGIAAGEAVLAALGIA
ncbi:MAG: FAD-dependent oxidoreductase [Polyangiaceae bacterium]|nr:FAD-dependent oxidoreductase [Polyangiaceae bacterium]